jgi:hypothetical protein
MVSWQSVLRGDPLPWLLEPDNPSVRYFALRDLFDRPEDDLAAMAARAAIGSYRPIQASLDAQYPAGYWVKPGAGYNPKYRSTVWQLILLGQVGADGNDPRIARACSYVLEHTQTEAGGFEASGRKSEKRPEPLRTYDCLTGNLVRALNDLGWGGDERVKRAVHWQACAAVGGDGASYCAEGTTGPGFTCRQNQDQPCAWGAIKALRGFAAIPADRRTPEVRQAINVGTDLLLSRDPAVADYPAGDGKTSPHWFELGFPVLGTADVLQNLETLAALGYARDERLGHAVEWLLAKQDRDGRWKNERSYSRKLWMDFDRQGEPSKWVTLRALRFLKAAVPA